MFDFLRETEGQSQPQVVGGAWGEDYDAEPLRSLIILSVDIWELRDTERRMDTYSAAQSSQVKLRGPAPSPPQPCPQVEQSISLVSISLPTIL